MRYEATIPTPKAGALARLSYAPSRLHTLCNRLCDMAFKATDPGVSIPVIKLTVRHTHINGL